MVRGKHEPVNIYEVLDYHTPETFPHLMEAVNYFRNGLDCYRQGDWDRAIQYFCEAQALNPQDKLPHLYIERCTALKDSPPEGNWTGVWVMKTK